MREMELAVVTGGSRGLGRELCLGLSKYPFQKVINIDVVEPEEDVGEIMEYIECDITNKAQLLVARERINKEHGQVDLLLNNAAVNHHNYLEDLTEEEFMRVINVNVKGLYLTCKVFLPHLKETEGTICNIVSNASDKPMTASLGYNASKGAQQIMTKQLARELTRRHNITVFSASPNKLDGTHMSKQIDEWCPEVRGWTKEEAKEYQLNGLLTGEETDPRAIAEVLSFILAKKERHKFMTGCDLGFGE